MELLYDRWGYNLEAPGWFSGDMHHHSLHSDGINTVYENIINNGMVIQEIDTRPFQGAYSAQVETTVEVKPVTNGLHSDGWLVVEVFGEWPSMAMTNALYLDFAPYGRWGAAGWTFPLEASTWFNEFSDVGPTPGCKLNVPAITVADGPAQSPWQLPAVTPCDFFVIR